MKILFFLLISTMLSACSSTGEDYSNVKDWNNYGYQSGFSGELKKSPDELAHTDKNKYNQYLNGYKKGQQAYCKQDAYLLGLTSQVYNGVCDKIDPSFALEYQQGLSKISSYGSHSKDSAISGQSSSP
ncbi:DUF2799 domain-containing protein [Vibrio profundum]|uniref:DUF2799 domain-containing protein n=1 Tax=Vibrio profundum TaxID=2910247 RepID=UPI003D11F747